MLETWQQAKIEGSSGVLGKAILRVSRLVAAVAVIVTAAAGARGAEITVFAAASLQSALDRISEDWQTQTGHVAVMSYGGSPMLARQIEFGAPADIFLSASPEWMDALQIKGLIDTPTRRDLLGNGLVLVAHDADGPLTITRDTDLAGALQGGKLAMALVDSVPAGQYAKQSLQTLDLWASVEPQVVQVENVRMALALVASGEVPFGIVYATDAMAERSVSVVAALPEDSHAPIVYPVARVFDGKPEARDFLEFLSGSAASAVFIEQGFRVLDP